MKTLKQILNREVYEPTSPGDKKFIDKHKVDKVKKSKAAENDVQFSGGTKPSKTKANANSNGSFAGGPSKNVAEEVKVGDKVHLGFGAKGGAGFKGTVHKIDGDNVHITSDNKKTYKGPKKFVTKEETEVSEQYIKGRMPAKGETYKISKPDHPEYNKKFKYVGKSDKGEHFHKFKDTEGKIRAFHATHVKHVSLHEETEELTEGYAEKNREYLNKALGCAKEIVDHLTFLNNWKPSSDEPYLASPYYDAKYLYRRMEDLYDDIDNQVDSLQSSPKKDTK